LILFKALLGFHVRHLHQSIILILKGRDQKPFSGKSQDKGSIPLLKTTNQSLARRAPPAPLTKCALPFIPNLMNSLRKIEKSELHEIILPFGPKEIGQELFDDCSLCLELKAAIAKGEVERVPIQVEISLG
jgi:hypothetical protein